MVGMSTIFPSVAHYSAVAWGGPPPIILTAHLIWSAATPFTLLFGSMCLFRFDKARVIYLCLQQLKITGN